MTIYNNYYFNSSKKLDRNRRPKETEEGRNAFPQLDWEANSAAQRCTKENEDILLLNFSVFAQARKNCEFDTRCLPSFFGGTWPTRHTTAVRTKKPLYRFGSTWPTARMWLRWLGGGWPEKPFLIFHVFGPWCSCSVFQRWLTSNYANMICANSWLDFSKPSPMECSGQ